MKYLRILVCGLALQCSALPAMANWLYTPGAGPSAFVSFNSGTTPAGTGLCAAANTDCLANVPIALSGQPLFTAGTPGIVTANAGTNLNTSLLALETGGNLATLAGAITAARMQANVGQINGVTPLMGNGVTGTGSQRVTVASDNTPFTIVATQPTGSNLHIQCDSGCSGSGGTASAFGSAFPANGTAIGLTNGTNMVAWSATTTYGTAPAAIAVPAVNASVTASALPTGAAQEGGNLATIVTDFGAPGATACGSDTASCSLNQQMQRLAQRLTTINGTLNAPFQAGASIGNTTFAATQATAASLNATVVGTGTFAVQAASTLANETTKVIGTVRNLGNAGAIFDAATGAGAPANALQMGMAQGGNLVALTGTSGNLNVNIASGGGSGGTSSNFGSAFPAAGTAIGLTNGTNMVAWSATSNYGTAPGAITVPAVNASVTASALPSGAGTAANQATIITSLATIATNSGLPVPNGGPLGTPTETACAAPTSATSCDLVQIEKGILDAVTSPPPLGTTGGWTPLKLAALTNTATAIKASAGQLGKLYCYNPNSSVAYIQVYNVAAGSVTVGTTASLQTYGVPATSSAGFIMALVGDEYGTAISAAATTTAGGATAPSTAIDCNASYH